MTDYLGGGGLGEDLLDFGLSMIVNTPGLGNLLCTLQYYDGQATQQLNVSLNLTVGNALIQSWPNIWHDLSGAVSMQLTYLGGIVSGTCDVKLIYRQ